MDEAALVLPESFAALGLAQPLLKAAAAMGFETPSPIQEEMIPLALAGNDVLGQAKTGTGKTAAFGMPIVQLADPTGGVQAIVMTPTRELAVQVYEELRLIARFTAIKCAAVYGGASMGYQLRQLRENPQIVIGTPGRVQDMMQRGALNLGAVRWAVLDEVDRMLDIGFRDDIRRILRNVPGGAQKLFVSATLPDDVNRLVNEFSHDLNRLTLSSDKLTVEQVKQFYVSVQPWDKYRMLRALLKAEKPELAIVFTNTKHQTKRVADRLTEDGVDSRQIHGDLFQRQRDAVMRSFREQKISVLVATDLMGRGIDVDGITHIFNYDLPRDPEIYVHRIGRTARMGAVGVAIALVTPAEGGELTEIEKLINVEIARREVEGFTPSPPPPTEAAHIEIEQAREQRQAVSRLADTVHGDPGLVEKLGLPPKTLGSHFKTSRRKRRLR